MLNVGHLRLVVASLVVAILCALPVSASALVLSPAITESPTAAFTVGIQSPETGQAVSFDGSSSTDTGGTIVTYSWRFGDGARASGARPTHTYASPGTYSASLTVTDSGGHTSTVAHQVAVSQGPTAAFALSSAQPVDRAAITFDATSSASGALGAAIQTYSWSFGDGATATGATAAHTYTALGKYTVTLTVTDSAGARSTLSRSITVVDAPPVPAFGVPQGILVANQSITLDGGASVDPDGSIASYTWSFGDGATGTGRSVTHAYASPGAYAVQLTVRDNDGQSATSTHTLTVHALPQAAFGFAPSLPRELTATTFDASSSFTPDPGTTLSTYAWSFGDGTSASGSRSTHTYARAGTYTVRLDVTDSLGLTDATTAQVTVAHAAPTAAIAVRPAQPVRGQQVRFSGSSTHAPDEPAVTYTWRFGDGGSAAGRTPAHAYARAGRYVVSLTVSDTFGDSTTATTTVTVTRHGAVTGIDARATRAGATMLVSVNSAGTLTVKRRTLSIKGPGTAGVPIHLTASQLRSLRLRRPLNIRVSLRFAPRGGAARTTSVTISLQPSPTATGYLAAVRGR